VPFAGNVRDGGRWFLVGVATRLPCTLHNFTEIALNCLMSRPPDSITPSQMQQSHSHPHLFKIVTPVKVETELKNFHLAPQPTPVKSVCPQLPRGFWPSQTSRRMPPTCGDIQRASSKAEPQFFTLRHAMKEIRERQFSHHLAWTCYRACIAMPIGMVPTTFLRTSPGH